MNQIVSSLPHVLSGQRLEIQDAKAGVISYYVDGPTKSSEDLTAGSAAPLLLIHSINAAPSAHEVKPLYDACKASRPTYALDLPGFGHSERSERTYCQRLMVDAILAILHQIKADHPDQTIDALSVSLSGEFLAKAALEAPDSIRSLAMVSPTGFARITKTHGPPEANIGRPGVYRTISRPRVGRNIYKLLTVRPSIRFFLKKTFGRKEIDEEMFEHACRLSRTPDAHRAPLYFIAGYLFSADIRTVFRALRLPVWLSHGVRGDFIDFSCTDGITEQPNWHTTVFDSGALPYFEMPERFIKAYEDFLGQIESGQTTSQPTDQSP